MTPRPDGPVRPVALGRRVLAHFLAPAGAASPREHDGTVATPRAPADEGLGSLPDVRASAAREDAAVSVPEVRARPPADAVAPPPPMAEILQLRRPARPLPARGAYSVAVAARGAVVEHPVPAPARPEVVPAPRSGGPAPTWPRRRSGRLAARDEVARQAPARDEATIPAAVRPPRVVVLGAPADVPAVAAAAATSLRRQGTPLVACWSPDPIDAELEYPSTRAARRLAERLSAARADGAPAVVPRGRLAWMPLAGDAAIAAEQYELLCGARRRGPVAAGVSAGSDAAEHPVVLALAGARPEAFEPAVAGADRTLLVIADGEDELAELARTSLPAGDTVVTTPPLSGVARLAALAGFGRLADAGVLRVTAGRLA